MTERSVLVRLRADASQFNRTLAGAATNTRAFVKELDSSNNQTSMLVQSLMAIAPALVPIGGAATVAITSLASSLSFTAGAGITAALAFSGVGDSLEALNEYQLEPSAENLAKLREEFDKLGPAGAEFVVFLQSLRPQMQELQELAGEGLFPGLQEGMESAFEQMPVFERLVSNTAEAMGRLAADAGEALTDPFWTEFFTFLEREAAPSIDVFFRSLGNITEAMAAMWMAFEPINTDFAEGMLAMTEDFARWAKELGETQGFKDFIDYIRETGPQVLDTLGSLGTAFVQLIEAAAPLGGPTLVIIETLADTISLIADSPAGTTLLAVASGLAAVSRAVALYNIANGSALAQFIGKTGEDGKKSIPAIRGIAAAVGLLGLSMTDLDDKIGLSNTAAGVFLGTMAGPWGAVLGGAAGLVLDVAAANDDLTTSIENANKVARSDNTVIIQQNLENLRRELAETDAAIAKAGQTDPLLNFITDDTDYAGWGEFAKGQISTYIDGIKGEMAGLSDGMSGARVDAEREIAYLEQVLRELEMQTGDVGTVFKDALLPTLGMTAEEFDIAAVSADAFLESLEDIEGLLSRRSSLRDYQAALDEFTEGLKAKNNGLARDIGTEEGRANQANLDAIATTALKVAENLKGVNRLEFLKGARQDFLNAAETMKVPERVAERLANKIFRVGEAADEVDGKKPRVDVKAPGADRTKGDLEDVTEAAENVPDLVDLLVDAKDNATPTLDRVAGMMQMLDGDTSTVTVTTVHQEFWEDVMRPRNPGSRSAAGNIFRAFAAGDVANAHQPMIAPGAKHVRVWAEEETKGESYIPHADDWRRPRAIRIWEETGRILGVNFQRFAAGGLTPQLTRTQSSGSQQVVVVQAEMPKRVQLVVGGQVFDAHVRNVADGAVADHDAFQGTLGRRG